MSWLMRLKQYMSGFYVHTRGTETRQIQLHLLQSSQARITGGDSDYLLGQCACELPRGVHGLKEKLLFMILIGCVRFILLS